MREVIRVVAARQTCSACPSQWEGVTEDGRVVYARYRFGRLTVGVGHVGPDAVRNSMGDTPVAEIAHGDEYDGYMDPYTLADLTADTVEWPWSRDPR